MKGLLIKDLLNMRRYAKLMLLFALFYAVLFSASGMTGISSVIVLVFSMLVITTISYDDMAKWDRYALTMPVTKRDIVCSKYVLLLLFTGAGVVLSLIIEAIIAVVQRQINIPETLMAAEAVLLISLLFGAVMLPLIYRFGAEKARILLLLVVLLPTVLITGGMTLLKNLGFTLEASGLNTILQYGLVFSPVIVALLLYGSYRLSRHIFEKRDI